MRGFIQWGTQFRWCAGAGDIQVQLEIWLKVDGRLLLLNLYAIYRCKVYFVYFSRLFSFFLTKFLFFIQGPSPLQMNVKTTYSTVMCWQPDTTPTKSIIHQNPQVILYFSLELPRKCQFHSPWFFPIFPKNLGFSGVKTKLCRYQSSPKLSNVHILIIFVFNISCLSFPPP